MDFNDQKIDELLRQVDVPDDLKSRLREIPVAADDQELTEKVADKSTHKPAKSRHGKFVLAASILAAGISMIALFVNWSSNQPVVGPESMAHSENNPATQIENDSAIENSSHELLQEIYDDLAQVDEVLQMMAIHQKESALQSMRATAQFDRAVYDAISEHDSASLVLTLSNQSALRLGIDKSIVSKNLQEIVRDMPGSLGAELASEILQTGL